MRKILYSGKTLREIKEYQKSKERCAKWIIKILKEHNGEISFKELQYLAIPHIYDRKDLYEAITAIEDKVELDSSGGLFNQKLKLIK
jgi:hypothetical protein